MKFFKIGDQVMAPNPRKHPKKPLHSRRNEVPGIIRGQISPRGEELIVVGFQDPYSGIPKEAEHANKALHEQVLGLLPESDKNYFLYPTEGELKGHLLRTDCYCTWNKHPKYCKCER